MKPHLSNKVILLLLTIFVAADFGGVAHGQRTTSTSSVRGFILTGDVRVDEGKGTDPGPTVLDVLLYTTGNQVVSRQRITPNGRYKFLDVFAGDYYLVIEYENKEIARTTIYISTTSPSEIKQDLTLEWRSSGGNSAGKPVVSAGDLYQRTGSNKLLYKKSSDAIEAKNYKDAIAALRQIVAADSGDFPAWSDLGMLYFIQKDYDAAEKSYAGSLAVRPDYFPALLNRGRVQMARADYEHAAESLEAAIKIDPKSAAANYFLGETYLQMKKGSKAVGYFSQALAIDPVGMADAHLRLAALYNGAGMKDRAAAEYEGFLKAKPDYSDRKKLEEYISANKKP
jgi:tetratricopeptide (TPR) repeat protein